MKNLKEYLGIGLGTCFGMLLILFLAWLWGYFYNGFTMHRYDIDSCWKGAGIVASGFFTLIMRYFIDSKYNNGQGTRPSYRSDITPQTRDDRFGL